MIELVWFTVTMCASDCEKSNAFQEELLHTVVDTDLSNVPFFSRSWNWCILCLWALFWKQRTYFTVENCHKCVQAVVKNLEHFRRNCDTRWFLLTNQMSQFFKSSYTRCIFVLWGRLWSQVHLRMAHIADLDIDLKLWSDFSKTLNRLVIRVPKCF